MSPPAVEILDGSGNIVTSDNSDVVTLAIASGPGNFLAGSITSATATSGIAVFSNLTLVVPGSYTLSAAVGNSYPVAQSAPFSVLPLQVVTGSFAGTPSGFSLTFNTSYLVTSTTPVLYGQGFGATAPKPSVTLTQTKDGLGNVVNKPIQGSLVLSTATAGLTFVATDTALEQANKSPVLPDGTYVADVHSSAATDGFQALNAGGGFLDGLGTGIAGSGDYTATFTVNVAAAHDDVLWVPATADGPGLALNAAGKNQLNPGYPIYLDAAAANVTSVQATLSYNPTYLTVTPTSTATFTVSVPTSGTALVTYSGPALLVGSQTPVGFLSATVPAGTVGSPTPYKAKDLLTLSNVTLNGGAIPAVPENGLHLVSYVGDADGNGQYSSNDAVLVTRALLNTDTGFTAYPLVDPIIVSDTDGAGFIPADGAFQDNEAGVGLPTANLPIPPVPPGVVFQAIPNNVDPSVSVGRGAWGVQRDDRSTVTVPVNIDDARPQGSSGLIQGHLALAYDPRQFTVSAGDIHLGSLLAAGRDWSVTANVDQIRGQIGITLSSDTPLTSSVGGSLVTIDFHLRPGEPGALATGDVRLVASATPNGHYETTELEDAQGTFTLTPGPSNTVDLRMDGVAVSAPPPGAVLVDKLQTTVVSAATPDAFVVLNHPAEVTDESEPPSSATILETTVPDAAPAPAAPQETSKVFVSAVAAGSFIAVPVTIALPGLVLPASPAAIILGQQPASDLWLQSVVREPANLGSPGLRIDPAQAPALATDILFGSDVGSGQDDWIHAENADIVTQTAASPQPATPGTNTTDNHVSAPAVDAYFAWLFADEVNVDSD